MMASYASPVIWSRKTAWELRGSLWSRLEKQLDINAHPRSRGGTRCSPREPQSRSQPECAARLNHVASDVAQRRIETLDRQIAIPAPPTPNQLRFRALRGRN